MTTYKELCVERAQESLAMAQKMIALYQSANGPASAESRIQAAATHATQAAAHLNQLVGLLVAGVEA